MNSKKIINRYFLWILILPLTMGCFLTSMARSFLSDPTSTALPPVVEELPATAEPVQEPLPEISTAVPVPPEVQGGEESPESVCTKIEELAICVPENLADSLVVSTIPEVSGENAAPWEVGPQHYQIDFQGYPIQNTFWMPKMTIYPVEDFFAIAQDLILPPIEEFSKILSEKPEQLTSFPFLPLVNAGSLISARPVYYDESTLSVTGFSVLTQYGQSFWPINNKDMFYTFQGMTVDGKYWISLILPVTQQDLPPDGEYITNQDFETFANDFPEYIQKTTDLLDAAESSSFTPDLDSFEKVIRLSFSQ